ncbi:MAG: hypothetical protein OHK0024_35960 [Thalassobaculales bacterium]
MAGLSPAIAAMLRAAMAAGHSQAAIARRCGISTAALSMLLRGTYPASPARVERRVERALGSVACPHLRRDLPALECQGYRSRRMPTSAPHSIAHWSACQNCPVGKRLASDTTDGGSP